MSPSPCAQCGHAAGDHTSAENDCPRISVPYCEGSEDCTCEGFQ
jgi:hypothetical protein